MSPGPQPQSRTAIVLLAHGSPDPRHGRDVHSLAAAVRHATSWMPVAAGRRAARAWSTAPPAPAQRRFDWPRPPAVSVAFLDHHGPTPVGCAEQLARAGSMSALVVPVFTAHAYHLAVDVPRAVADMQEVGLPASLLEPGIAGSPRLLDVALNVALESRRPAILYAAGSSSRTACDRLREQVAELSAESGVPLATAFLAGGPDLSAARAELADRGVAATAMVLPFVIAEGILRDRMAVECQAQGMPLAGGSLCSSWGTADLIAGLAGDALRPYRPVVPALG